MGIFIALLLVSSWIQSMWKLTFYPRLLRLAVLGGLSLFIMFASERLSGYNLHDIAVLLESKERLDTLCALVVMQEFSLKVKNAYQQQTEISSEEWDIPKARFISLPLLLLLQAQCLEG